MMPQPSNNCLPRILYAYYIGNTLKECIHSDFLKENVTAIRFFFFCSNTVIAIHISPRKCRGIINQDMLFWDCFGWKFTKSVTLCSWSNKRDFVALSNICITIKGQRVVLELLGSFSWLCLFLVSCSSNTKPFCIAAQFTRLKTANYKGCRNWWTIYLHISIPK